MDMAGKETLGKMRRPHHIHPNDLMEPDLLSETVLVLALLGIVGLLASFVQFIR